MNSVILLLGGNLGDRMQTIHDAEEKIEREIGKITKRSKVYETASWGDTTLNPFLNRVVEAETELTPHQVMSKILQIEESIGRKRIHKWESRIIDIDILFYGDKIIQLPDLVIPHPFLHLRRFTLVPLVEIYASKIHPLLKKTIRQLLEELTDPLEVVEYDVLHRL